MTYTVRRHAFYGPDYAGIWNEKPIHARSHKSAYEALCGRLKVDGPRTLYAFRNGAELCASLYDGCSYIRSKAGRLLHIS